MPRKISLRRSMPKKQNRFELPDELRKEIEDKTGAKVLTPSAEMVDYFEEVLDPLTDEELKDLFASLCLSQSVSSKIKVVYLLVNFSTVVTEVLGKKDRGNLVELVRLQDAARHAADIMMEGIEAEREEHEEIPTNSTIN